MTTTPVVLDSPALTRLLRVAGVKAGGRILDVGCGDGAVVDALDDLGYEAFGMDERVQDPDGILFDRSAAESVPVEGVSLAIIRGTEAFTSGLSDIECHVATANLLAAMRGGGSVAFLAAGGWQQSTGETPDQAAVVAHLARYGVDAAVVELADSVGLIGRLLGRNAAASGTIVLGTLPKQRLSKLEYHSIAREAAMSPLRRAA